MFIDTFFCQCIQHTQTHTYIPVLKKHPDAYRKNTMIGNAFSVKYIHVHVQVSTIPHLPYMY